MGEIHITIGRSDRYAISDDRLPVNADILPVDGEITLEITQLDLAVPVEDVQGVFDTVDLDT